ncbi:MAG TPA: class I SAM-dependent methyltransferase [Pyrinomonadaceae bacterium]
MNPTINEAAELAPQPTPVRIFHTLTAYQQTAALKAAIELELFTAIAEGNDTAAKLAARTGAAERGVRILCDYLTVSLFLGKCPDGRYTLAPEAAIFLDRRSPAYVGGIAEFLSGAHLGDAFRQFTESVRKGGTVLEDQGSMTADHPMWEDFARGMASVMRPAAADIAQLTGVAEMGDCKILDIAAGHGLFGITLAEQNAAAEVYALDWQNVLAIARRNAEAAGVGARYHLIPGSAFEVDYGTGYDLVLLTNFFHHFDPPTCETLMRKCHAALKTGGRAVTLEFVPNEDRVSPPDEAAFALVMLGTTPAGDAYTFPEFERMFRNAGFSRSESHQTMPGHIIISYK